MKDTVTFNNITLQKDFYNISNNIKLIDMLPETNVEIIGNTTNNLELFYNNKNHLKNEISLKNFNNVKLNLRNLNTSKFLTVANCRTINIHIIDIEKIKLLKNIKNVNLKIFQKQEIAKPALFFGLINSQTFLISRYINHYLKLLNDFYSKSFNIKNVNCIYPEKEFLLYAKKEIVDFIMNFTEYINNNVNYENFINNIFHFYQNNIMFIKKYKIDRIYPILNKNKNYKNYIKKTSGKIIELI